MKEIALVRCVLIVANRANGKTLHIARTAFVKNSAFTGNTMSQQGRGVVEKDHVQFMAGEERRKRFRTLLQQRTSGCHVGGINPDADINIAFP